MRFTEAGLEGAWIVEPQPATDERGSFARTFCVREFGERELETRFVQQSHSHSVRAGTLRGMHFQAEPHGEVKLVSCLRGAIFDVIADLRGGSPSYLNWIGVELSEENRKQLYVPKGFAHGFITLCDDVLVNYLISEFHAPAAARGVPYDDPALGIVWPARPTMVSQRDLSWPYLALDTG
jgi:dTDP-4-dehydrorhamnose 3,5-epimerase